MKYKDVAIDYDNKNITAISLSKLLKLKIVDVQIELESTCDEEDEDYPAVSIVPVRIVFENGKTLYIWQEHNQMWLDFDKMMCDPPKRPKQDLLDKIYKEAYNE